ncbi:MAG: SGNH/GDSL hydrolase family protein [Verrucomicrobia bacterium]|nr:SGNH/GDSL hydrolase family protein [Verrucomicrobiota bacterium]
MRHCLSLVLSLTCLIRTEAAEFESLPTDSYFAVFKPLRAPAADGLWLRPGDRLAICGDSITEQKMYSRIIETYLAVCAPELGVEVRQFGWSGERAPGFLARMTNDVLRFGPTIATTCYGMNDHRYQPSTEEIRREYRASSEAVIRAFKAHGVRVIQGAPGTVGKMPHWVQEAKGTVTDLNLGLLELRNIDVTLAQQEQVGFADVYLPMLVGGYQAQQRWGTDYMITGKDGVHPDWAGQLVMAYAFLKALGLNGEIGTVTLDLESGTATTTAGHRVLSATAERIDLESARYPFCAAGPADQDGSIRSGMAVVPFNRELNRFVLRLEHPRAEQYRITWGEQSHVYPASALEAGVNLADDFQTNPFTAAFRRVDEAVARKQAYETRQIKELFHGPEGRTDLETTAQLTERVRQPLVAAIRGEFRPVSHTLHLKPE